jgi:succinoglycan biosynthesis protein ExoM
VEKNSEFREDSTANIQQMNSTERPIPTREVSVAVCVLTYKRPVGLERLLKELNKLEFRKCVPPQLELVVIDNDPAGSAYSVFEALRSSLRWPAQYRIERRPGIAYARNQAVATAGPSKEYIAFIDDDEVPEPGWLDELLDVRRRYDADLVTGTVLPHFEETPPEWVLKLGYFDRPRYSTGCELDYARTGNVLIKSSLFWQQGIWFDERLAQTNADDTHFFMRVHRCGNKIVWADEAVIREHVPKDRLRIGWLLRQSCLGGNWYGECEFGLERSQRTRLERFAKGLARIGYGVCLLSASLFRGTHVFLDGLRQMALGSGMVLSGVGIRLKVR